MSAEGKINQEALKVDPPIHGQNWVVLSFVSPEDLIVKRNLYYMNHWLYYEVNKTLKDQAVHAAKKINAQFSTSIQETLNRLEGSTNEVEKLVYHQLRTVRDKLTVDEEAFAKEILHDYHLDLEEIQDRFSIYQSQHQAEIDSMFDAENHFATSVRGVKIRGVYNTREDANERAQFVRDNVEKGVHAYVGQMGHWLAWDPDPDNIKDANYLNSDLNKLMQKYHDNVQAKNQFFEERKTEMMEDAKKDRRARLKEQLKAKLRDRKGGSN